MHEGGAVELDNSVAHRVLLLAGGPSPRWPRQASVDGNKVALGEPVSPAVLLILGVELLQVRHLGRGSTVG